MKPLTHRVRVNGHALNAFRRIAGKSQVRLAAETGVNHSYISRLERGQRNACTRTIIEEIARALDVPVAALLAPAKDM